MTRRDEHVLNHLYHNTEVPSFFHRTSSYQTILLVSTLCKAFLYGLNKTEVHNLPRFLDLLQSRSDYKTRRRGLITVSNHISVLDEPLIWGVLPLSFPLYHGYMNHRFSLGAHDILFKNGFLRHFFTLGQTLPIHRAAYTVPSSSGGPFQPSMTEAVRLLTAINARKFTFNPYNEPSLHVEPQNPSWPRDCVDPFSDIIPAPSYSPNRYLPHLYFSPSRYASNSYSWIHTFPEGMIHQSPNHTYNMRYFKWGVARLILEPPECPDLVPIFIEGTDQVMHESRSFPRFLPRVGKQITVTFGNEVDTRAVFGDLRQKWRELADRDFETAVGKETADASRDAVVGLMPPSLMEHPEAVELRIECARRVREEVLKVRRSRGYLDEDPKSGVAETWRREGPEREGRMRDGSWVKDEP